MLAHYARAELTEEALGQRSLEKNGIALVQPRREEDDDTDFSNSSSRGPKVASIDTIARTDIRHWAGTATTMIAGT